MESLSAVLFFISIVVKRFVLLRLNAMVIFGSEWKIMMLEKLAFSCCVIFKPQSFPILLSDLNYLGMETYDPKLSANFAMTFV